jgi:hypothetical protein
MVEIDCICCGAELPGRNPHPRSLTHAMCERCTDDMARVQLALELSKQESRPATIH